MISVDSIKDGLETSLIGNSVIYLDEVASTNDQAKKLAGEGATEGTVILAETQTFGRGRFERRWHSPPGGVWMSIILRPSVGPPLQKITLLIGLSVAKTLRELYKVHAVLKWPNDVQVEGKKICGILVEGSFRGSTPVFVIVGIGINVNIDMKKLPAGLRRGVTSIQALLGKRVPLNALIRSLLETIDRDYDLFKKRDDRDLWFQYTNLCQTIGLKVRIESAEGEIYEGLAERISPEGGLVLSTEDGEKLTVLAGDCFHLSAKKVTKKDIKREVGKVCH